MSDKKNILFVDDEENVLSSMRRMLRKNAAQWDMAFANSGAEAVELAKVKNIAVVVSDMRMPEMDGLETLSAIKDTSPDTVRIMLTGNADQLTAINAINEGEIFRFFTKPCDRDTLVKGIESAIRQHNLITAEKELLEQTLAGSLRVLIDARALSGDDETCPSKLVRKWSKEAAKGLNIKPAWPLEMAANLFDIARFAIPAELTLKIKLGKELTPAEQTILNNMPQNSHDLIANIPRLSKIANIVLHHMRGFDGSGLPKNGPVGAELPLESRVLKIVHDAAEHHIKGATLAESFQILEGDPAYDPGLLDRIRSYLLNAAFDGKEGEEMETIPLAVQSLEPGMLIAGNVEGENGNLLLAAGERISDVQIALLRNWVACGTFAGKVDVSLPSSRVDAMLSVA